MTRTWEQEWVEGLRAFHDQARGDGITLTFQLIRGRDFDATITAAKAGSKDARRFMNAFVEWDRMVTAAAKTGTSIACFDCGAVIRPRENFGGLAVASPKKGRGAAMTAAFCCECQRKGKAALSKRFEETIAEDVGGTFHGMH
jgi:hypothetical protein